MTGFAAIQWNGNRVPQISLTEADNQRLASLSYAAGESGTEVAIVFDFGCAVCRREIPHLEYLAAEEGVALRVLLAPLTDDGTDWRYLTAMAGVCAAEQGRLLQFMAEFEARPAQDFGAGTTTVELERLLRMSGVESTACLAHKATAQRVADAVRFAEQLGIHSRPSFVIGPAVIPGYATHNEITDLARAYQAELND